MATYFWVGGAGTWDDTSTTNWAASSGGAGSADVPTFADNAVFDSASNATGYTVTIDSTAVCNDWTVAGPVSGSVTFAGTGGMRIHGSLTWPATKMTRSYTGTTSFLATSTGKIITTNGVGFGAAITFDGVGGGWTLGSALTATSQTITLSNGSFDTGNYNITAGVMSFSNSNVRSLTLGSSTVTLNQTNPWPLTTTTNLTFNAGTSSIVLSGTNKNFRGGGQTYYNLTLNAGNGGTSNVLGGGAFNNLTIGSQTTTGRKSVLIDTSITVNGTLTLGAANTNIRKMYVSGSDSAVKIGDSQVTITAASLATLSDVNFRNIKAAGVSANWSGTRIGNALNNDGITFTAAADKYWNLVGGGNLTATAWSLSSGGAVSADNYPLPQDKIIINNTGINSGSTITIATDAQLGEIDASALTNAITITFNATTEFYDDFTLSNSITLAGSDSAFFWGQGKTQKVTMSGASATFTWQISASNGVVQFQDAFNGTTVQLRRGALEFAAGQTSTFSTALSFTNDFNNQVVLQSNSTGNQATISQSSGIVSASFATIQDINATGGATFNAFTTNNNVDAGNNTGWDFFTQLGKYIYTRRKNKRILLN